MTTKTTTTSTAAKDAREILSALTRKNRCFAPCLWRKSRLSGKSFTAYTLPRRAIWHAKGAHRYKKTAAAGVR